MSSSHYSLSEDHWVDKVVEIEAAIAQQNVWKLRELALQEGGLVNGALLLVGRLWTSFPITHTYILQIDFVREPGHCSWAFPSLLPSPTAAATRRPLE